MTKFAEVVIFSEVSHLLSIRMERILIGEL